MSLKAQAKSGMIWTFAQQFGTQIISFAISIVLARLLVPEDFGVIALFGVVMGIASAFINGGMGSSLIRSNDVDEKDFSTVFIFNIVLSLLMYAVVFILAPFISDFYNMPILTNIIRVYSITLIISAFNIIQSTRLSKDMAFKTMFKIQLPSLIIGGLTGIGFAYSGFGVWSLVYSALIQNIISTIQYWIYGKWKPKLIFDVQKFKIHFSFGYRMTLSSLLDIIFNNIYPIIIGKIYSPTQLGYYNRADSLKQLPVSNLSNALNKVTFPLFAKISQDDVKLKDVYQRLLRVVIFIIAPTLALMVVLAEPIIRFLLTEKWLPAVPYLQILAISGLLYPIHAYNLNILQVKGRSDLFLRLEIIKKILIVIILICSLPFGIYGLLWGKVIGSVLAFFINTHYTGKFLNYTFWQQILDLFPSIILAGLAGLGVYLINQYITNGWMDLINITISTILFMIIYLGCAFILNFKEILHIKQLIKK
ncbi:MAG: lipopolysaccharide biosynthesis protein [Weeksellaceae bacterium]|nr:lipopolysaccharide biosynthesis protein [Weeksellaceae bacterium]